jgi:hypothetical protein
MVMQVAVLQEYEGVCTYIMYTLAHVCDLHCTEMVTVVA